MKCDKMQLVAGLLAVAIAAPAYAGELETLASEKGGAFETIISLPAKIGERIKHEWNRIKSDDRSGNAVNGGCGEGYHPAPFTTEEGLVCTPDRPFNLRGDPASGYTEETFDGEGGPYTRRIYNSYKCYNGDDEVACPQIQFPRHEEPQAP